jgi:hypothetical protein
MTDRDRGTGSGATGKRRFTDSEVALVLRKAVELEEAAGSSGGSGLSLDELKDIGKEVGISPESIAKAVAGLDRRGPKGGLLPSGALVQRAVYAIDGELSSEGIARLVRSIDERTDGAGEVSEALGSVRWTTRDRFRGTQVSITPENGETSIQVVEKALPHFRRVVYTVPAGWGAMLGGLVMGVIPGGGSMGIAASLMALGVAVGAGVGRFAWARLSAESRNRVELMAAELSREAREIAKGGDVVTASRSEEE